MNITKIAVTLFIPTLAFCVPPGSPMSEFGPSQVALSVFYDHSGQDVYLDPAPSVLNTTGLSVDYGPWQYLQVGLYGGAAELDIAVPEAKVSDTSAHSFNTNYTVFGGVSGKLATPHFAANMLRGVGYGSLGYVNNSDANKNNRMVFVYNAGASIQCLLMTRLNLILGGEFYAFEGTQKNSKVADQPFGVSAPNGTADYFRGLIGVEYFFKGKNKPFVSVAFRPTPNIGWNDDLGISNASISISLGAIASFGKGNVNDNSDDDAPKMIEQ